MKRYMGAGDGRCKMEKILFKPLTRREKNIINAEKKRLWELNNKDKRKDYGRKFRRNNLIKTIEEPQDDRDNPIWWNS